MEISESEFAVILNALTEIGYLLSKEKDHTKLLELILKKAKKLSHADAGTIYSCTEEKTLKFEIILNDTLQIHMGGTSNKPIDFKDLPLYDQKGKPILTMLAPASVTQKKTIVIADAYKETFYNLEGTKQFDKTTGYHSQSFLTVPMTNHLDEVIGVLQLINATDSQTKRVIPFKKTALDLVEALASLAAITLTNRELINAQKELFDSFIKLIAKAIDEKSPYTGGHCRRVPVIAKLIAKATNRTDKGPLKDFHLNEEEMYELEVAAWLHDCGKITTPEAVVDKATKLEGIMDGINLISLRFEVLKRDLIIKKLTLELEQAGLTTKQDKALQQELQNLDNALEELKRLNLGGEFLSKEQIDTIEKIAALHWHGPSGTEEPILTAQEIHHLKILRGTLSDKERAIINNHVSVTLKMLKSLPYPKALKNVPELAGSHHEKMDGTGYPRGLKKQDMPVAARIIAIADVFEALTAADRPYKKAMPLQQALTILGRMKLDDHIDADLFDVFMNMKVYEDYAKQYLPNQNLSDIDLTKIPGYGNI